MKKQGDKISYARLVTRADFYKKKALDLEQQVVFAEEKAEAIQKKLDGVEKTLKANVKGNDDELIKLRESQRSLVEQNRILENQCNELQQQLKGLKEKWEESRAALEEKAEASRKELEEKAEAFRKELSEKEASIEQLRKHGGEEKIKGFEKLLQEVQVALNEKEETIHAYQKRMKSLERRIGLQQAVPSPKVVNELSTSTANQTSRNAIAYFDYSIIIDANKDAIIRGNFHIENVGSEPLGTPFVCFRFYPVDAAGLKGKILSLDQLSRNEGLKTPRWVFMEDEWGNEAKERGEIWVRPYEEWQLKPDDSLVLTDFQIPVKKHYDENIIVEGFVYFQKDDYKQKASNQILISF